MKIKIHNEEWNVIITPPHSELLMIEGIWFSGTVWPDERLIVLSNMMPEELARRTALKLLVKAYVSSSYFKHSQKSSVSDIFFLFSTSIIEMGDVLDKVMQTFNSAQKEAK